MLNEIDLKEVTLLPSDSYTLCRKGRVRQIMFF